MSKVIETDTKTFVKFWLVPLGILLLGLFLYSAQQGLIVIGLSIFLALALRPLVRKVNDFFSRHFGANKKFGTASAVLAYLIVVLVLGGILAVVGPVVVAETGKFIQHFPETFETALGGWDGINNFGKTLGIENLQGEINSTIEAWSAQITSFFSTNFVIGISGVASTVMNIFLVLILTMLFLLEGPGLLESIWDKIGAGEENKEPVKVARRVVSKMANVVSIYVSRQMIVALIDGLATCLIVFVLSLFMNISSGLALPMGLITLTFYMIPMFGQFIGGTLVTLILLFTNPLTAVIFAAIYIIYAQFENNVLAPKVQGDALRLPAVVILSAVIIGMYMFGMLGAIIAIPIAGCIRVLVDEYPNIRAASKA